uniref:HK97 family phage prohead protease n=1 Tax=Staphylococcus aureus TaxID=1280 RepID=UPI0019D16776
MRKMLSDLQVKASAEPGMVEGYASLFGVTDSDGDEVMAGAYDASLTEWRGKTHKLPILWQHDANEPIGVWTDMRTDKTGLYVRG